MPEGTQMPVIGRSRPSAATLVLLAGACALCLFAPAAATGEVAAGQPPPSRPGTGLTGHITGAALATAAGRGARWAANAGFSDDGYLAGGLVTAVAVALAESGCTPAACFDDTRSRACSEAAMRRADSIDRGAWQLNSKAWRSISNRCAFDGPCAARAAYMKISSVGTFFARWTQYATDAFAHYLWAAQGAVSGLRAGTVTSALAGSCLGYPRDRRGGGGPPAHARGGGGPGPARRGRPAGQLQRRGRPDLARRGLRPAHHAGAVPVGDRPAPVRRGEAGPLLSPQRAAAVAADPASSAVQSGRPPVPGRPERRRQAGADPDRREMREDQAADVVQT